jgi:hypothetical protein
MATLKNTTVSDTGAVQLPVGTTAQRPGSPSAGQMRYNSTFKTVETYDGSRWRYMPDIVRNGLVLHLDAGEPSSYPGSGTTWTDLSGNGNNGTLTNGPTYSSSDGGSIVFDDVDDYIDFTSEPDLNGKSFSAGCWFKTTDTSMRLIQNCSTGSFGTKNGFQISVTTSTFANTGVTDSSGNSVVFSSVSSTPYTDGNWHFICLTFNTTTGTAKLYLDGNFANYGTNSGLIGANMNGVGLEIGRANSSTQYLGGNISNAFMYNKALTPKEIKQNYEALRGRFGI